ncbi:putative transcription factor GLK2 [Triticum urartu]|uniref:Putative transcription factor GLK2 n=1 Tax=Triticum urartu TaxID=4572 RepID=M7Z4G6_TRIUA|nr:putative transcription factor GLK2 [Triticum urartu]
MADDPWIINEWVKTVMPLGVLKMESFEDLLRSPARDPLPKICQPDTEDRTCALCGQDEDFNHIFSLEFLPKFYGDVPKKWLSVPGHEPTGYISRSSIYPPIEIAAIVKPAEIWSGFWCKDYFQVNSFPSPPILRATYAEIGMLEVATLQSPNPAVFSLGDHHHVDVGFPEATVEEDDFLLDYIDFSTCDMPFFHVDDGDDILPDLEVDPTELLAEFADEPATTTVLSPAAEPAPDGCETHHGDEAKTAVETDLPAEMDMELPEGKGETKGLMSSSEEKDVKQQHDNKNNKNNNNNIVGDEVCSAVTTDDSSAAVGSENSKSSASAEGHSKMTSKPASAAAATKSPHGRRKVKVDWTPELHRRFVQAVEQLGLDKAAARKWGPQAVTQCVPPPMPPAAMMQRFAAPPMPGMVPHPMYRPIPPPPSPVPQSNKVAGLQLQLDAHPSKESIDAAIGDVLVKPWLPLPLGLKPPSLDSVMSELHKQGIPKVPPAATTNCGGAA